MRVEGSVGQTVYHRIWKSALHNCFHPYIYIYIYEDTILEIFSLNAYNYLVETLHRPPTFLMVVFVPNDKAFP